MQTCLPRPPSSSSFPPDSSPFDTLTPAAIAQTDFHFGCNASISSLHSLRQRRAQEQNRRPELLYSTSSRYADILTTDLMASQKSPYVDFFLNRVSLGELILFCRGSKCILKLKAVVFRFKKISVRWYS